MRAEILPILLMLAAPSLGAQRLVTPHWTTATPAAPLNHFDSTGAGSGDHALAGAKVGGLVLGLGAIGLAYGWCNQGDGGHPTSFGYCAPRAVLGGLMGATLGAVIGGFIGSTVPKAPSDSTP